MATAPSQDDEQHVMTEAHTPTPWFVDGKELRGKYAGAFCICPNAGPPFVYLTKGRDDIQKANAAFIVRAVNAYEDLRALEAAARDVVAAVRRTSDHREWLGPLGALIAAVESSPTALSKAKATA